MTIQVNGTPREISAAPLPEALQEIGLPPHGLLIEHNGLALRPAEWPHIVLQDGDQLEILRIAAGG